METKQYKAPNGDLMKVEMVDEVNKQVYATTNGTNHKWFLEREYSLWIEIPILYVPDIPAQIIEEVKAERLPEEILIEAPLIEIVEEPKKKEPKKKTDDKANKK